MIPKIISFTKTWHSQPYPFISPSRPELSAAGKNVVVTGGGTGIGLAISTAFARAGAKSVTIIGRRVEKLEAGVTAIRAAAGQSVAVRYEVADLVRADDVRRALRSTVDHSGNIDILVSNAGAVPVPGPVADLKPADLTSAFEGNVLAPLNVLQAFLPLAGPEPVLLSTSSSMSHWSPTPGMGIYTVTKAAALKLMDVAAVENHKLRIVNVQPGWVATDMNGHQEEAPDSADLPGNFYVWLASKEAALLRGKLVWANWDAEELVARASEIANSRLLSTVLDGVPM
ncbi:hypothetical protein PLIIFM63780_003519 [Purpureocillium lilacinum]|nr:hypothetical protein PLIIFM63780_003519 [Purpureocillium lilacinum]